MNAEALYFVLTAFILILPLIALKLGREWLIALHPIFLITGNVFAQSFTSVFGLLTSFAIPVYAGTFLVTDLLSEHYGRREALRAVWVGIAGQIIFLGVLAVVLLGPVQPEYQEAFKQALSIIPRLIIGSFIAFITAQHVDVIVYHTLKSLSGGKIDNLSIAVRNNISTWFSQAIDTLIFLTIAFLGTEMFPTFGSLLPFMLFTWLFKVGVALFDTAAIIYSKKIVLNTKK